MRTVMASANACLSMMLPPMAFLGRLKCMAGLESPTRHSLQQPLTITLTNTNSNPDYDLSRNPHPDPYSEPEPDSNPNPSPKSKACSTTDTILAPNPT